MKGELQNSVDVSGNIAHEFYELLKDSIIKYTKSLIKNRRNLYGLTSDRKLLGFTERFIKEKYKEKYKIDYAISSGVEERYKKECMMIFNDNHAEIIVDKNAEPRVRFYWIMHEIGHILLNFEGLSKSRGSWTSHYFEVENKSDRICSEFAFTFYKLAFNDLNLHPPIKSFKPITENDVLSLIAFHQPSSYYLNSSKNEYNTWLESGKSGEVNILKNEIDKTLKPIKNNIFKIEQSLINMELKLEGLL